MQAVDEDDGAGDGAEGGDGAEAEVGFLDEVLEVHAVEGGGEGAGGEAEGVDGEFEVELHEGIAVSIEDGTNTV